VRSVSSVYVTYTIDECAHMRETECISWKIKVYKNDRNGQEWTPNLLSAFCISFMAERNL